MRPASAVQAPGAGCAGWASSGQSSFLNRNTLPVPWVLSQDRLLTEDNPVLRSAQGWRRRRKQEQRRVCPEMRLCNSCAKAERAGRGGSSGGLPPPPPQLS